MIVALRNIPVAKHFMYSLVVHLAILSFLLTVPIYGGGGESSGWYLVYLKNTAEINRKETRVKETAPTNKASIKNDATNRKTPVLTKTDKAISDIKSVPKKEMEKPETTSSAIDELINKSEIPWPLDQPVVAEETAPAMLAAKEKEMPQVTAPQIKEEPIEEEQGQQIEVESESAPSTAERGFDQELASVPQEPKLNLPVASLTNPIQNENVKEPGIPGPHDQTVVSEETTPVMSGAKDREMPEGGPRMKEKPMEKEQGQQVAVEGESASSNLEKESDRGAVSALEEQEPYTPPKLQAENSAINKKPSPPLVRTGEDEGVGMIKSPEENPLNAAREKTDKETDYGQGHSQVELNAESKQKGRIIFSSANKVPFENISSDDLLSARTEKNPHQSSVAGPQVEEKKAPDNETLKDKRKNETKEGNPAVGISVPAALFQKDIKIEVSSAGEISGLSVRLLKRPYPADNSETPVEKPEIEITEEKGEGKNIAWPKRTFSVARAEKGIYNLLIENKEEKACDIDIVFRFYEGGPRSRIKGYSAVRLLPAKIAKFMFVMPDMIFWDDEDRFSGVIEDSNSVTKFIYDTGMVWKEEKDY